MTQSDPVFTALTAAKMPFEIGERGGLRQFTNAPPDINYLLENAREHGDKIFAVEGERRITFEELFVLRDALVTKLNIQRGDRVAICMRNQIEWMVAFLASVRTGGIAALINSRGAPDELCAAINDVSPAIVLADADRAALLRNGGYEGLILEAESFPITGPKLDALIPASADDPCTILFTSGTTGRVKGAVLSHRNVINGLMSIQLSGLMVLHTMAKSYNMDVAGIMANMPQQGAILVYPLFHISGLSASFLTPLCTGSKIILMHKWDAVEATRIIEREKITMFSGVPTMLWDLLNGAKKTGADLSSLRNISCGGQALPVNLLDQVRAACPAAIMGTGYGMTETSGSISMAVGEDYIRNRAAAGRVLSLFDIRIEDANGDELPSGQAGEIVVKGPAVMLGYWNNKAETDAVKSADGWLKTGDIGYVDAEGYVFIVDRKKDMVISGGENIYCAEVERIIGEMPDVAECATFGIADERLGEILVAVVVASDNITKSDIIDSVSDKLAKYKAPADVIFLSQPLPRNSIGKINKLVLRSRWTELSGG